jgi:hypothetical protein
MSKKILYMLILVLSAGLLSACVHTNTTPSNYDAEVESDAMIKDDTKMEDDAVIEDESMMDEQTMKVMLGQVADSEQSGTAMLSEDVDGNLIIELQLSGGNYTQPQPAHIHVGSCPGVGAVEYPLTSVTNGNSTTTLEGVSLADVTNVSGGLAINVHKSAAEASIYTACGELL